MGVASGRGRCVWAARSSKVFCTRQRERIAEISFWEALVISTAHAGTLMRKYPASSTKIYKNASYSRARKKQPLTERHIIQHTFHQRVAYFTRCYIFPFSIPNFIFTQKEKPSSPMAMSIIMSNSFELRQPRHEGLRN